MDHDEIVVFTMFLNLMGMYLELEEMEEEEEEKQMEFLTVCFQFLNLAYQYLELPDTLTRRLFPGLNRQRNNPRDILAILRNKPLVFWHMTGLTPAWFDVVCDEISFDVAQPRNVRGKYPEDAVREPRACGLSTENRILMAVIWLRQYPSYASLQSLFQIDKSTASDDVHHVIPILYRFLEGIIQWPTDQEFEQLWGRWDHFPNAVLALDATIHRVTRPLIGQHMFYRGDKKCHFMLSQITCAPDGHIVDLEAGFFGSNDAGHYANSMVGRGEKLLPPWAKILADGGYPNRDPLIIPYTKEESEGDEDRLLENEWHRFYRSQVERTIHFLKVFRSVAHIFRHPKYFQPFVVQVVGALTNVRIEIIHQLEAEEEMEGIEEDGEDGEEFANLVAEMEM